MIYDSRRQAAMRGYRPSAARKEGQAFYGELTRPRNLKRQRLLEQRFRIHLAVALWDYARRLGVVDPVAAWPGPRASFAKFADDLQDVVADILGIAEALPMPPHDPAKTQVELAVAAAIGVRRSKALGKFAIAEVVALIEEAYGRATTERNAAPPKPVEERRKGA